MFDRMDTPQVLQGDVAVDDRGEVAFVNDFAFSDVKRFYMVSNHTARFVRAWHAHRREAKYILAVRGASLVGAVAIDNWDRPSPNAKVWRYVLTAHKPAVLHVPAGYANGFMSLTDDAALIFFSTATLDDSRTDDVRYPARHWDIWSVEER